MELKLSCEFEYRHKDYDPNNIYTDKKNFPTNIIIYYKNENNIFLRYNLIFHNYAIDNMENEIKKLILQINNFLSNVENNYEESFGLLLESEGGMKLDLFYNGKNKKIIMSLYKNYDIDNYYIQYVFEKDIILYYLNNIVYHLENPEICFPKKLYNKSESHIDSYKYEF